MICVIFALDTESLSSSFSCLSFLFVHLFLFNNPFACLYCLPCIASCPPPPFPSLAFFFSAPCNIQQIYGTLGGWGGGYMLILVNMHTCAYVHVRVCVRVDDTAGSTRSYFDGNSSEWRSVKISSDEGASNSSSAAVTATAARPVSPRKNVHSTSSQKKSPHHLKPRRHSSIDGLKDRGSDRGTNGFSPPRRVSYSGITSKLTAGSTQHTAHTTRVPQTS